jgi:hypothetical protein
MSRYGKVAAIVAGAALTGCTTFGDTSGTDLEWNLALVGGEQLPTARGGHAMAYDAARDRLVLFGGRVGDTHVADTWEFDGAAWTEVSAQTQPLPRYNHAMVYDAARERVLLFGGGAGLGNEARYLDDLWEWDGASWSPVTPAGGAGPAPRAGHMMAYDAARDRVVVYGGSVDGGFGHELWEWDGSQWRDRTDALFELLESPVLDMAYDEGRSRVVAVTRTDTWAWDGATWNQVAARPDGLDPSQWRYDDDVVMSYDAARGQLVILDRPGGGEASQTWTLTGSTWTRAHDDSPSRTGAAMAYHAGLERLVLFGGSAPRGRATNDLWEWDGAGWAETARSEPDLLSGGPLVYDAGRERVVLLGSARRTDASGTQLETWEWDGRAWRDVSPEVMPADRSFPSMAYDAARGHVVLFSGHSGSGSVQLTDTWTWDGERWTEVTPAAGSPPVQLDAPMVYDAAREVVVLLARDGRTWTWDGASWTDVTPDSGPLVDQNSTVDLAYDEVRERVVASALRPVWDGEDEAGWDEEYEAAPVWDLWEWDGQTWHDTGGEHDTRAVAGWFGILEAVLLVSPDQALWAWDGKDLVFLPIAGAVPTASTITWTYDSVRERAVLFDVDSSETWELGIRGAGD